MLKTFKDHTGKDIIINLDHVLLIQPGLQKGLLKLVTSNNIGIDIMDDGSLLTSVKAVSDAAQ